jgi:hypothetical protein
MTTDVRASGWNAAVTRDLINISTYLRFPVQTLKKYDDDTVLPRFYHRAPLVVDKTRDAFKGCGGRRKTKTPIAFPNRFEPFRPLINVDTRSLREIQGISSRDIGRYI